MSKSTGVCVCVSQQDSSVTISHTPSSFSSLQEELKAYHTDRRKEVNQQKALDRTRVNDPANKRRIVSSIITYNAMIT